MIFNKDIIQSSAVSVINNSMLVLRLFLFENVFDKEDFAKKLLVGDELPVNYHIVVIIYGEKNKSNTTDIETFFSPNRVCHLIRKLCKTPLILQIVN